MSRSSIRRLSVTKVIINRFPNRKYFSNKLSEIIDKTCNKNTLNSIIFVCLVCAAGDLPADFHNSIVTNLDTAKEPYFATNVVFYQCVTNFRPIPENAPLTCTCTANEAGDAASWICNPDISKLSTTCQPSE